jgi:hypothetical protein
MAAQRGALSWKNSAWHLFEGRACHCERSEAIQRVNANEESWSLRQASAKRL